MVKVDYMKDNEEKEGTMSEDDKKSPRRILVQSKGKTNINPDSLNQDILIVASKLKKYVKDKHGLNTSGNVMQILSDIVRLSCDRAVDKARQEGRKTLMDRDF